MVYTFQATTFFQSGVSSFKTNIARHFTYRTYAPINVKLAGGGGGRQGMG